MMDPNVCLPVGWVGLLVERLVGKLVGWLVMKIGWLCRLVGWSVCQCLKGRKVTNALFGVLGLFSFAYLAYI